MDAKTGTRVEIKNRWTGDVLYVAEVSADTPSGMHMRVATPDEFRDVLLAIAQSARKANMRRAA